MRLVITWTASCDKNPGAGCFFVIRLWAMFLMKKHTCSHMHVYLCVFIYIYINIYVYIYIYTYRCQHISTHV